MMLSVERDMSKRQKDQKKNSDTELRLRIISALSDSRWDYRTIEGISAELRIPKQQVEVLLLKDPDIRMSIMKDAQGRRLYTTKRRKSKLGDIYTAFRALNSSKVGS